MPLAGRVVAAVTGVIGPPCDAGAHGRRCQVFA
jgi:hypothetical protein